MDRNDALVRVLRHLAAHADPGDFAEIEIDEARDNPAPERLRLARVSFDVNMVVFNTDRIKVFDALGQLMDGQPH